jgi:hypothetical protein
MKDSDKRKFSAMMTQTSEVYSREISGTLLKTYWDLLKDYDVADVEKAFHAHQLDPDNGRFFPLPAHIVAKLEKQTDELQRKRLIAKWENEGLGYDGNETRKVLQAD